ncbi:MAG: hypothetical protein E5X76_14450 [Mesorhizobium sp.]|nr:MAG: hypothetical protein E5X76_14450 [Mesorhizobium sp.]
MADEVGRGGVCLAAAPEEEIGTTFWLASTASASAILTAKDRAFAVVRNVSSLESRPSSLASLAERSKIVSRSKIDFCEYGLVATYLTAPPVFRVRKFVCGSLEKQAGDTVDPSVSQLVAVRRGPPNFQPILYLGTL